MEGGETLLLIGLTQLREGGLEWEGRTRLDPGLISGLCWLPSWPPGSLLCSDPATSQFWPPLRVSPDSTLEPLLALSGQFRD